VDYIASQSDAQASVLDTMNVAMGVTLREGGGAKTGAPLHSVKDKQHMSREVWTDG